MIETGPQPELTSDQKKRILYLTKILIGNELPKSEQSKALFLLESRKYLARAVSELAGQKNLLVGRKHYLETISWILFTIIQVEIMKDTKSVAGKTATPLEKPWMKHNRYS